MKKTGKAAATTLNKPTRKRKPVEVDRITWMVYAQNYFADEAVQAAIVKKINKETLADLKVTRERRRENSKNYSPIFLESLYSIRRELPVDVSFKIKRGYEKGGNVIITLIPKYKRTRAKK